MKNYTLLILLLSVFATVSYGQKTFFSNPVENFSKKKTSYITLSDGTELVGKLKKFDWKKGLFEGIVIIVNDKKKKLTADEISHMYLYPSGLQKMLDFDDLTKSRKKVVDNTMNHERLQEGYVYFEQAECYYKKKKKKTMLLQLLNTSFSNKVKVFFDPLAKESASIGIGSMKLAGGEAKSYFIQKGNEPAFRLKKKNYNETAGQLFDDCSDFFNSIKDDLKWKNLGGHILEYSSACN